ncbi:sugar nucleotide-binding protein [Cellvibrio mixtus]|uniref:sugar nucleotide-binding protein n=1 Tax=Cellvibrio mixtus TaxID=39650 RepID=UPI0005879267|nr:sugar nucleotide-binding protein [Cellvibrio mixtus]
MSFTLLLTDVISPLGKSLEHELEREPFKMLVPGADVDWSSPASLARYMENHKIDLVLNCRGWEEAYHAGGQGPLLQAAQLLSTYCAAADIPLIHFSSYSVFGADPKGTHSEKDTPAPVSDTGSAFMATEQLVAEVPRHIILRLSWVIGAFGDNLLTRLLSAYLAGASVSVNRRMRGAPTALSDAARVAVALIKQISSGAENWGIMHYCSGDSCTEDEFAEQLLQLLIQQQLLTAEPSLTLVDEEPEHEPLSAILGCRRVRDYFGVQARSWRPSLLPLVKQWLHNREQTRRP